MRGRKTLPRTLLERLDAEPRPCVFSAGDGGFDKWEILSPRMAAMNEWRHRRTTRPNSEPRGHLEASQGRVRARWSAVYGSRAHFPGEGAVAERATSAGTVDRGMETPS